MQAEIAAKPPVDIGPIIDGARFGSLQVTVFVLSLLCMTFEGYDTYAVSYIGPKLLALWQLSTATLALIFTAGTVGSAVGYLAIGPLADRLGRRIPVVVGTAVFGVLSVLSTSAGGPTAFIVWRVLVGLALARCCPTSWPSPRKSARRAAGHWWSWCSTAALRSARHWPESSPDASCPPWAGARYCGSVAGFRSCCRLRCGGCCPNRRAS